MFQIFQRLFGANSGNSNGSSRNNRSNDHRNTNAATPAPALDTPFIATLHEDRVVVHLPNGTREEVEWKNLESVIVRNSDKGTWANDTWLILIGTKKSRQGCVVPTTAENYDALLEHVRAMLGFDNDAFARAMTESGSEDFVCWQRSKQRDTKGSGDRAA